MRIESALLELKEDESECLVFCKEQIIASDQIGVLIIKPSNAITNANNTAENVNSIVGRIEDKGWELQAVKLLAGSPSNVAKIIAHYSQPFYDSQTEDVQPHLSAVEQKALIRIWGKAASQYPIYHPTQLVESGTTDYQTLAKIWHAGRGNNNRLLDSGSADGINTITPDKDGRYGKRRLLLVSNHPALPNVRPFFIVNGFAAELITKFSRAKERIVIMAFGQKSSAAVHDLDNIREHTIGATNPHNAKAGSIRHDALHSRDYFGKYPVTSYDTVGIENNIVHFSDSVAEAARELALWMPELMWYPSEGLFAPDIGHKTWQSLRRRYLKRQLRIHPTVPDVTSPDANKLRKWSTLPIPTDNVAISVNMMAGGSGGRFFGYELPEHLRNKMLAPIVPIDNKVYSFLELQLARLVERQFVKSINIIAAGNTSQPIQAKLDELAVHAPALADVIEKTTILIRRDVPRIVPSAEDLLAESKFQEYCAEHHINATERASSLTQGAGDILKVNRALSSKPPGHLSVFLNYMYHRLRQDLIDGVEIAFFHIGEDAAADLEARFIMHAKQNEAIVTVGVVESSTIQGGYLITSAGKLQLMELSENVGVTAPFYVNTCRMAINTQALARFLAGDSATFVDMSEIDIRQSVTAKIIDKLTPRFEIKPVDNYTQWAGQFAYAIGQVSEVLPTEFILCDDMYQKILTFKTKEELADILPIVRRQYKPYLHYLPD